VRDGVGETVEFVGDFRQNAESADDGSEFGADPKMIEDTRRR